MAHGLSVAQKIAAYCGQLHRLYEELEESKYSESAARDALVKRLGEGGKEYLEYAAKHASNQELWDLIIETLKVRYAIKESEAVALKPEKFRR